MSHEEHEGSEAHEGVSLELERLSRAVVDAGPKVCKALVLSGDFVSIASFVIFV